MNSKDRLTALPDELLHHIFSFLDSLYIVQASVVSRRFRRLHASAPAFSFSFSRYVNWVNGTGSDYRFSFLVDGCLRLRDKKLPVHKLVYDASDQIVKPEVIEDLLSKAVQQGVQELQLTLGLLKFGLPACLYTSLSLKELTLRSRFVSLSNELGFPALTKLHLELQQFSDSKVNGDIISRCPNLETLILRDCNIDDRMKRFSIAAPKLKKLEISYSYDLWYIPMDCEFVITAPNLAFFSYRGTRAVNCSLSCPCSLDAVEIDVFQGKDELYYGGLNVDWKIEKVSGLISMIKVFKSAGIIKISQTTKKCLSQAAGLGLEDPLNGR